MLRKHPCSVLQLYLVWTVPTLLLWPYASICPFSLPNVTNKGKQSTIFYCNKEVQTSLICILCDFWCKHFVNIYHLRSKDVIKLATVTGEGLPMEGIWIDGWFKWANIWDAPWFPSSKRHATKFFVCSLTVAFTEWGLHAIHFLDPNSKPMHQRFPGIQYKYLQC